MVIINNKLVIGHKVLKNIPTQNRSNCTLYTTLNRIAPYYKCDCIIEMRCGDDFLLNRIVKYSTKNDPKLCIYIINNHTNLSSKWNKAYLCPKRK